MSNRRLGALLPDPHGRWGYVRNGTVRQFDPRPFSKHNAYFNKIKESSPVVKLLLYIKWGLGWWMTFLPIYPFLFLIDAGESMQVLIYGITLLPLIILFSPLLLIGCFGWGASTLLQQMLGTQTSSIILGLYLVIMFIFVVYSVISLKGYFLRAFCDIRSPYKSDRL